MDYSFADFVIFFTTIMATITDLYNRTIYHILTVPVFLGGLVFSFWPYRGLLERGFPGAGDISFILHVIWDWLGLVIIVLGYSILLFWLGVLDGGDGHFLIAITPWCSPYQISNIIILFYPLAFCFLLCYLLYQYKWKMGSLIKDQISDTIILVHYFPRIVKNIIEMEPYALQRGIPYSTCRKVRINPPAMVPFLLAVAVTLI